MPELDEADEMELALRRSTRRRNLAIIVVLAAAITAPFAKIFWDSHKVTVANDAFEAKRQQEQAREEAVHHIPLTEAEASELRSRAPKLHAEVAALGDTWLRATEMAALANVAPGSGSCPITLQAPTATAAESYVNSGSIDLNYFGSVQYDVITANEVVPDPGFAKWLATADAIAARVADGRLERPDLEASHELLHAKPQIFVVADSKRDPFVTSNGYEAGSLQGHAYVFSFDAGKIICAAELAVENRSHIDITYYAMKGAALDEEVKRNDAARGVLARDLEVAMRAAIARNLRSTR